MENENSLFAGFCAWLTNLRPKSVFQSSEKVQEKRTYKIGMVDPNWIEESIRFFPAFNEDMEGVLLTPLTEEAFREGCKYEDIISNDLRITLQDVGSLQEAIDLCRWGTYGKNGKSPLKWTLLRNCSTEHLEAILRTQQHITVDYKMVILAILEKRRNATRLSA